MHKALKAAQRLADGIRLVFNWVYIGLIFCSKFLIVALVAVTSTHVFMRYVLGGGLRWAEEVALILVIWFTFIAMALGVKKNLHISINVLPKRMPQWLDTGLFKLKALVIFIVAFVMVYYGRDLFRAGMRSTLPATGMPAGIQHLAIPVAGVLMLYDSFMDLCGFDKKDRYIDEHVFRDEEEDV